LFGSTFRREIKSSLKYSKCATPVSALVSADECSVFFPGGLGACLDSHKLSLKPVNMKMFWWGAEEKDKPYQTPKGLAWSMLTIQCLPNGDEGAGANPGWRILVEFATTRTQIRCFNSGKIVD